MHAQVTPALAALDSAVVTDETLAKEAQGGDRDAFGALYQRYAANVRGYVANRVPDRDAVDDVAQDIFLQALAMLAGCGAQRGEYCGGDQPGTFGRWLFGVPARFALNEYFRTRCHDATAQHGAADELRLSADQAFAPAADVPLSAGMAAMLAALPPRQREVVELRFLDGLPVETTAAVLDIRSHTVKRRAAEAMPRLGRPAGQPGRANHKRDGTPAVYREGGKWRGHAWVASPDGTARKKHFRAETREAALALWADLTGADLASAA